MSSKNKGYFCEEKVKDFFIQKNFELVFENLKTPFAEIDLLFKDQKNNYHIVEVKKSNNRERPLSFKQAQRLARATDYIAAETQCFVRCHLALLDENFKIDIIEDALSELV